MCNCGRFGPDSEQVLRDTGQCLNFLLAKQRFELKSCIWEVGQLLLTQVTGPCCLWSTSDPTSVNRREKKLFSNPNYHSRELSIFLNLLRFLAISLMLGPQWEGHSGMELSIMQFGKKVNGPFTLEPSPVNSSYFGEQSSWGEEEKAAFTQQITFQQLESDLVLSSTTKWLLGVVWETYPGMDTILAEPPLFCFLVV